MDIPPKYEDVVAQLEAERELHKLATETLGQFADENQKLHADLAALREELDERTRKHLRSCKLAIGRSQLAKELRQRLTVAEQRAGELEGLLKGSLESVRFDLEKVESREAETYLVALVASIEAALKPAEEDDSDLQKIGFVRMNTKTDQPRISLADMHARYDRKPCQEPQARPTRCGCEDLSHDQ